MHDFKILKVLNFRVKVATTTGDITIEGTTDSYAVVNKLDAVLEDLRTPNTPENNEFPQFYKH